MSAVPSGLNWVVQPFPAFAIGSGIMIVGVGLYIALGNETLDRAAVEAATDRTREIGEDRLANVVGVTDQLLREDDAEDVVDESPAITVLATMIAAAIYVGLLFYTYGLVQHMSDATLQAVLDRLPAPGGDGLYASLVAVLETDPAYLMTFVVTLAVLWFTLGRVTVVLMEEYA